MRIERPRSPFQEFYRGRLRYRVGPYQMEMLKMVAGLGVAEPPPAGKITATGKLREHILNDMLPLGFVAIKPTRTPGMTDYVVTKIGREVLKYGITTSPPKTQKRSLLAKQRQRQRAEAAAAASQQRRRQQRGTGRQREQHRISA